MELPTLLLAHARTGELPALAEAARPATGAAPLRVTYRVCARPTDGRTTSVKRVFGDDAADAQLLPALGAASWLLPEATSGDEEVCFLENLESAPDGQWRVTARPHLPTGPERVERPDNVEPELPHRVAQPLVGKVVVGLYRMCAFAGSGAVASASPVVGIPGADGPITEALRTWRYRRATAESCWIEPLRFTLTEDRELPTLLRLMSKLPRDHRAP